VKGLTRVRREFGKIYGMQRREFVTLMGGLAMLPLTASAQQSPGRMTRIAFLGASSPTVIDPRQMEGFKHGLSEN
jgi:hypothetical protein